MEFLSKEIENLLQECIDRSDDFPAVLAEKFEGLSAKDDNQLRSCIKVLIDEGYISKLSWGSNVPYYGRIEQKDMIIFVKRKYISGRNCVKIHISLCWMMSLKKHCVNCLSPPKCI